MIYLTLLCAYVLADGDRAQTPVPQSLVRAIEARRAIVSGRLEWTLRREENLPGREFRFESLYAFNGDRIFRARGDQDGWVEYDLRARTPRHRFPINYLLNADGAWMMPETSVILRHWPLTPGSPQIGQDNEVTDALVDPRGMGLSPHAGTCIVLGKCFDADATGIASELHKQLRGPVWNEREYDERYEVTATCPDGAVARWRIDPRRGWSVEGCTMVDADGAKADCNIQLREIDGVWFPAEVRFSRNGGVLTEFKLGSAAVNQPDDRDEFGPNDIGTEPGFNISPQTRAGEGTDGLLIWDGDRIVAGEAWYAAVKRGEKRPGPTMEARRRGEHSKYLTPEQLADWQGQHDRMHAAAVADAAQSAWQRYTVSICQQFELDAEQRQKAKQILADCQEQAGKIMGSIRGDLVGMQAEMSAARRKGEGDKVTEMQRRIVDKVQPIEEIYQRQLVPRLDQLPTRRQRDAAALRAESQPASRSSSP